MMMMKEIEHSVTYMRSILEHDSKTQTMIVKCNEFSKEIN